MTTVSLPRLNRQQHQSIHVRFSSKSTASGETGSYRNAHLTGKSRDVIPYFELAVHVTAIKLDPDSLAMRTMWLEIGAEENAAGRGILSALVVPRPGQRQPDLEFLYLADGLGKDFSDIWQCLLQELKRVFNCWSKARRKQTFHRCMAKQPECGGASGAIWWFGMPHFRG